MAINYTKQPPEYNPNGDRNNGVLGSMTPSSVLNQFSQSKPVSGNPFSDMLLHSADRKINAIPLKKQKNPGMSVSMNATSELPPITTQPVKPPINAGISHIDPDNPNGPKGNTGVVPPDLRGGENGNTGIVPPPGATSDPRNPNGALAGAPATGNGLPPPATPQETHPTGFAGQDLNPTIPETLTDGHGNTWTVPSRPANVSDEIWQTAKRWAQGAIDAGHGNDYMWILQDPNVIQRYRANPKGMNFTDWARAEGYVSPIDRGTTKYSYSPDESGQVPPGSAPPPGTTPRVPHPRSPEQVAHAQQVMRDRQSYNNHGVAPGSAPGTTPTGVPGVGGAVPPNGGGTGAPNGNPGVVGPGAPNANPNGAPSITPFNGNQNYGDIAAQYRAGMNPEFQNEQRDLARALTQHAAITGEINSGGNATTFGRSMGDLIAKQGADVADKAFQARESALNRTLDFSKFSNNFELEKWMASQDQTLKRYGIDQQTLMDKYKSELALKGEMYSADRGVDAAALHAAAASAAAEAGAQASMYNAQLGYQSNMLNSDVDRERNIMNYELGIAGLGPEYAKWLFSTSPEALLGGLQPPGQVIVNP
jgi:hypothetical protein